VKNADDIRGFEYDWLACDADGQVALFSTAGGGYVPPEVLADLDAHDAAIETILAMPESTDAVMAPTLPLGIPNTWCDVAERGLYAFDADVHGGPYRLIAAPAEPVLVRALPPEVAVVVRTATLMHVRFRGATHVSAEDLSATGRHPREP